MPPKKKRKVTPDSDKPGLARQFIEEQFSDVPSENVKNGHVLFLYFQCKSSLAETVTLLKEKLHGEWKIESHHISKLVNKTLKKHKNLSRDSTMTMFSQLCHESFSLKPAFMGETLAAEVVSRPLSSAVSTLPSPVASTLLSSAESRLPSPIASRPMSAAESRPPSPVALGLLSSAVSMETTCITEPRAVMSSRSPLTTHVLDTATGTPARNLHIELFFQDTGGQWKPIAKGITNTDGRCPNLLTQDQFPAGMYRIHFGTGKYFQETKTKCFYPYVDIVFSIEDPSEHYHVPLLLSPFGYSTYRGS